MSGMTGRELEQREAGAGRQLLLYYSAINCVHYGEHYCRMTDQNSQDECMAFPPTTTTIRANLYKAICRNWKLAVIRIPDPNRYQFCTR